jgi:hypothetical protein
MNAIQRISRDLRTERLARELGVSDRQGLEPRQIRERWWRSRSRRHLGGGRSSVHDEASRFRFHSME